MQETVSDWGWSSEPVQDYADPLNAHLGYDARNTWGAWDLVQAYAWDKGRGHVIGCGPVSLLRVLEVYRRRGLQGIPWDITLRLPNDSLGYSGFSVRVPGGSTTGDGFPK